MSSVGLPPNPRNAQPGLAQLDDLLQFSEESAPVQPAQSRSWLVLSALLAFLLSAVAYTAFRIGDLAVPFALLFVLSLGVVLVRRAVKVTAEPVSRRVTDAVRAPALTGALDVAGWYEGGDGMQDAIRRWDRRLDWGSSSPSQFRATVLNRLGDLADERLRLRHSITRASDPTRARALLGEDTWRLLHGETTRVLKPKELAVVAQRLEIL